MDRNVVNLDLCLPEQVTAQPAIQPVFASPLRPLAAAPAGVPDASADLPAHTSIFPVTLLCQGEGAAYEHQLHCLPTQSQGGAMHAVDGLKFSTVLYKVTFTCTGALTFFAHAGVAHTGIWPGGLRNRTGGGETDGYSAACHECSAAKAHRDAEEDQVFGVKFSKKYSIQRL